MTFHFAYKDLRCRLSKAGEEETLKVCVVVIMKEKGWRSLWEVVQWEENDGKGTTREGFIHLDARPAWD